MSAHVLLKLLNELGKRDKMRGLTGLRILYSASVKSYQYFNFDILEIYNTAL